MLTSLSIKNYALIDDLFVDFSEGLTVVTGETGAGKSIILDAISLILGKRADLSSLKNSNQKCTIEAIFKISSYALSSIFKENQIDYDPKRFYEEKYFLQENQELLSTTPQLPST